MIIKNPSLTLTTGAAAAAEDYSDHVIAAMLDVAQSTVDDRTFGKPHASDVVSAAHSVTLSLRYSDDLMALLDGHEETELDMVLTPESGAGTLTGTVKFAYLPLPGATIGERVECELVLAVVDALDWTAAA